MNIEFATAVLHERLAIAWRTVATAVCFCLFGLGCCALGVFVFPALRLFVRDAAKRSLLAKAAVRAAMAAFVVAMRLTGVLSVEVRGRSRLRRQGLLVIANHPSLIDVVLLMSVLPRADCIVKSSLARHPLLRASIRAAGFQYNPSVDGLIADCIRSLRAGHNLIVFPEGTRTPVEGAIRFRRGAAAISVRAGVDLTPVRISCSPGVLRKGEPWWRSPARRPHFVLDIGDDIPSDVAGTEPLRATRRLNAHLNQYFQQRADAA